MSALPRVSLLMTLAAAAVAGASALSPAPREAGEAGATLLLVRQQDIEFYERRVAADPEGALDRMRLGALVLEQSRHTGDERGLARAEALARESLDLRTAHNTAAWRLLASALLGQHRFLEALEAAERVVAADPDSPGARALRGEVLLELGRYPAADSAFGALTVRRNDPAVAVRYARWLEIRRGAGDARLLLEQARQDAAREGAAADQLAWFDLRLGDLAFRHGNFREARSRTLSGLRAFPEDWRLLALAARIELAAGRARRAIALGDSTLARHLDPATLATVGDAWLALGDSTQAESYFKALETVAGTPPAGGFHRAWYLALLDHGRRVPEVLEAVSGEIVVRPDVYGWDLLAWALYRSGRIAESRDAIANALAVGTDDQQIAVHARAIMEER